MSLEPKQTPSARITARAILIGVASVLFLCAVTPYNDYYIRNTFFSGNHFPIGSFFIFTTLVLAVNPILRRFRPRSVLTPAELIVIWCMMLVAAGIPSSGYLRYHLFMLTAPFHFATPENDWVNLFHAYLPDWMVVKDPRAAREFYEGVGPDGRIPWEAWIRPAAVWTCYLLLTYFVLLCISVILRKQWVERERFAFPLVKLPQEMVETPPPNRLLNDFFRNPMTWIGFSIPVIIHTINGVHRHMPSFPEIPIYFYPDRYFTERPWTALRSTVVLIYPTVIGFTYLLSLDVSLSFWLFYLLYKAQSVALTALGMSTTGWTLANRQEMGGYLALIAFVLWMARRHIRDVVHGALKPRVADDANEMLSYRTAFFGLIFGTLGLAMLCRLAGMSFWVGFALHIFFYVMCVVLTWMVTDGGFLFLLAIFRPSDYMTVPLGTSRFPPRDLTLLAYEKTLMFDLREFMMPHFMNSFKAADIASINRRKLGLPILISILVAIPAMYVSGLWVWYAKGGNNLAYWWPPEPFDRLTNQLLRPTDGSWVETAYIGVGGVVMSFLIFMRYRFLWWRVHPLGYAMTTSWAPYTVWFSFFLGWLFKYSILKFTGFRGYRTFRPFFLGMVVGDAVMAGVWVLVGLFTHVPYQIMPG